MIYAVLSVHISNDGSLVNQEIELFDSREKVRDFLRAMAQFWQEDGCYVDHPGTDLMRVYTDSGIFRFSVRYNVPLQ